MVNKQIFAILGILSVIAIGSCIACQSNGSIKPLEEMTELEYSKWKLYIQLGVKIGANRLLKEQVVTTGELGTAAAVIDGIKGEPVTGGIKSLIMPALAKAGFQNDEVEFVLLIAEQELLARGALDWINPETNVLELSPRTVEVLGIISASLRSASVVTEEEASSAAELNANFCRVECQ